MESFNVRIALLAILLSLLIGLALGGAQTVIMGWVTSSNAPTRPLTVRASPTVVTPTPSATQTPPPTETSSPTAEPTAEPTATKRATREPTSTRTPRASRTPRATRTATQAATRTPKPTRTATQAATATESETASGSTATQTATESASGSSATQTATQTATRTPTAEQETQETDQSDAVTLVITASQLNMRQAPNTNATILIALVQNTEATVIGRNEDSTWVQIEITNPSLVGWTSASPEFVTISGDIEELPIIEIE